MEDRILPAKCQIWFESPVNEHLTQACEGAHYSNQSSKPGGRNADHN